MARSTLIAFSIFSVASDGRIAFKVISNWNRELFGEAVFYSLFGLEPEYGIDRVRSP